MHQDAGSAVDAGLQEQQAGRSLAVGQQAFVRLQMAEYR